MGSDIFHFLVGFGRFAAPYGALYHPLACLSGFHDLISLLIDEYPRVSRFAENVAVLREKKDLLDSVRGDGQYWDELEEENNEFWCVTDSPLRRLVRRIQSLNGASSAGASVLCAQRKKLRGDGDPLADNKMIQLWERTRVEICRSVRTVKKARNAFFRLGCLLGRAFIPENHVHIEQQSMLIPPRIIADYLSQANSLLPWIQGQLERCYREAAVREGHIAAVWELLWRSLPEIRKQSAHISGQQQYLSRDIQTIAEQPDAPSIRSEVHGPKIDDTRCNDNVENNVAIVMDEASASNSESVQNKKAQSDAALSSDSAESIIATLERASGSKVSLLNIAYFIEVNDEVELSATFSMIGGKIKERYKDAPRDTSTWSKAKAVLLECGLKFMPGKRRGARESNKIENIDERWRAAVREIKERHGKHSR